MSPEQNEALSREYITRLGVSSVKNGIRKPYIIAMTGLPGSGKSTFAQALHDATGIYISRNDDVRRFLNEKGYDGAAPIQETVEFINTRVRDMLYENKISHIIDADVIKFHEMFRSNAKKHDFASYLIKVECDAEELEQRINDRESGLQAGAGNSHMSMAGREILRERREVHETVAEPHYDFVYNSSNDDLDNAIGKLTYMIEQR